jgi:hypothetical protein
MCADLTVTQADWLAAYVERQRWILDLEYLYGKPVKRDYIPYERI